MKNILIINGHHRKNSFSSSIIEAYKKGALNQNAKVKLLEMSNANLNFIEGNLTEEGSLETNNITTEITKAQELIKWANHIVWVYPIWWYNMPSKLKSFIEHVFTSGFAFKYHKKGTGKYVKWDKYLTGKTSRIIATMDSPPLFFKLIYKDPNYKTMKGILNFCGIKSIKKTYFGSVKMSNEADRKKWLQNVENLGAQLK